MANRAIIYAIYPNKIQEEQCRKTFGCCRFVHNQMLTIQQERYKNGEKHLSKFQANTYCNQHLKKEYPFLKEVDKFALTHAVYHLEDGYDRFFKHLSRFPRYKSKHKAKKSYTTNFTNGNIAVGDDYVKLPKLGRVKAKIHRKPEEDWKIKSATITQNRDGTYQVSILFEYIADTVSALAAIQRSVWIISLMVFTPIVMVRPVVCHITIVILQNVWQKPNVSLSIRPWEVTTTRNSRNALPGSIGMWQTRGRIFYRKDLLR